MSLFFASPLSKIGSFPNPLHCFIKMQRTLLPFSSRQVPEIPLPGERLGGTQRPAVFSWSGGKLNALFLYNASVYLIGCLDHQCTVSILA